MNLSDYLTVREMRRLKRSKRQNKRFKKVSTFWTVLIIIALLLALLIGSTYSFMPACAYRTFMENHPAVYIVLFIVICLGYVPAYLLLQKRRSNFDNKICEKLALAELNADELMKIAEDYLLDCMFPYALSKRMEELGITEVPASCRDEYEVFRLPTKEDIQ